MRAFSPFCAIGTAIRGAAIVTFFPSRSLPIRANFSGAPATIGLALANVEVLFPLLSPRIEWVGAHLTGTVVVNNDNDKNLFA